MRPKSTARDLPPRMLRRVRQFKNGKRWEAFYYNGYDEQGRRVEIPLGTNLNDAKQKWAELECKPSPVETCLMCHVFDRYEREVVSQKKNQADNIRMLNNLRSVFCTAPIDAVTPQHIAQYRDARKKAPVAANREISIFSHVFNMAREWGYTARANPVRGVKKNLEPPRDYYAEDDVWQAVYNVAAVELQDAMDLAYLTGQRPADVLKMCFTDIRNGALEVNQNKTKKRLRILTQNDDGTLTALGELIEKIKARPRKIASVYIISTSDGQRLQSWQRRDRFNKARMIAARHADAAGDPALAERIRKFWFCDSRSKAASETKLDHASRLLGHTNTRITERVYRRVGDTVSPTK